MKKNTSNQRTDSGTLWMIMTPTDDFLNLFMDECAPRPPKQLTRGERLKAKHASVRTFLPPPTIHWDHFSDVESQSRQNTCGGESLK